MALISVLQARGVVGEVDANLELLTRFAHRAAEEGAEVLVSPELFPTGYAPAAVAGEDGARIRERISRLARDAGLAIVASTVEHDGTSRYICASLFDVDGAELTRYRKQHLFGDEEKSVFAHGADAPELVEVAGLRVALAICYDIEFPEVARSAALLGADALLIPTAVPSTGDVAGEHPGHSYNAETISTLMVPTRALENGIYVAYANHAGPGFTGLSCLASPYGNTLALAGREDTQLLTAELFPSETARSREVNAYLSDLR